MERSLCILVYFLNFLQTNNFKKHIFPAKPPSIILLNHNHIKSFPSAAMKTMKMQHFFKVFSFSCYQETYLLQKNRSRSSCGLKWGCASWKNKTISVFNLSFLPQSLHIIISARRLNSLQSHLPWDFCTAAKHGQKGSRQIFYASSNYERSSGSLREFHVIFSLDLPIISPLQLSFRSCGKDFWVF